MSSHSSSAPTLHFHWTEHLALVCCIGKNPGLIQDLLHLYTTVLLLSLAHVSTITALQKAVPPPKPSHLSLLSSQHGALVPPLSLQLCFGNACHWDCILCGLSEWLFSISSMHVSSSLFLHDCGVHFYHQIISHGSNVPQSVYLFTHWWTCGFLSNFAVP